VENRSQGDTPLAIEDPQSCTTAQKAASVAGYRRHAQRSRRSSPRCRRPKKPAPIRNITTFMKARICSATALVGVGRLDPRRSIRSHGPEASLRGRLPGQGIAGQGPYWGGELVASPALAEGLVARYLTTRREPGQSLNARRGRPGAVTLAMSLSTDCPPVTSHCLACRDPAPI